MNKEKLEDFLLCCKLTKKYLPTMWIFYKNLTLNEKNIKKLATVADHILEYTAGDL